MCVDIFNTCSHTKFPKKRFGTREGGLLPLHQKNTVLKTYTEISFVAPLVYVGPKDTS